MKFSTEARVGAVTLIGFILLGYMIIRLGDFSFGEKGYNIKVEFNQVNGLKEGSVVRYAGVDIGRVKAVRANGAGVEVTLSIRPGAQIAEGSKFSIGTDGLLGEKFISITPPRTLGSYLGRDAVVRGEDPQGMEQLVSSADQVLKDVQVLVHSLNEVFGDPKVKDAMKATALNAREISEQLNAFSASLARMAQNNEQDVNAMASNLRAMSGSLRDVAARVDTLMANVDNNGQTAKDLREAIQNLKNTSVRIENITASIEGVATDPETTRNIKETLRNTREASERANHMLKKIDDIEVEPGFEVLYNTHTTKYRSNADLRINTSADNFAVLGVTDIGEGNKANFQIGKGDGNFAGRAGLINGKAGVGADKQFGDQMRLSLDVYDPNDVRVKLRAQFEVAPDTFIVGETDGLNKKPEQNTFVGVRHSF